MNEDQTLKSLQLEFDEILTCIKPIYLNWKNQQDKISIAGWIKKLTNVKTNTVDSVHLRNLYVLALYENLRRDVICDPFTKTPPNDELPPLSNHLKQLIDKFSVKQSLFPDWLEIEEKTEITYAENTADYEEDDYMDDLKCSSDMNVAKQNMMFAVKPNEPDGNGMSFADIYKYHNSNVEWLRNSTNQAGEKECKSMEDNDILKVAHDDIRYKYKPNEFNTFNKFQEKELLLNNISGMERRLIQLQNAYHEDILKLRSQNDVEIQNIINRKNVEIEQVRSNYKDKSQEQETEMQKLDAKANDCLKQLQLFQDTKLKEIEIMKRNHAETIENFIRDNDQRNSNLVDDFLKEKNKLLDEHRKHEEILIKESKDYFDKVKVEFTEKANIMNHQIIDLETVNVELKNSKNIILEQNINLKSEKDDFIIELKKIQSELSDSQKRYLFMENQYNRLISSHEKDVESLTDTFQTALHNAQTSKAEIEVTSRDKIEKLENQIKDIQVKLQDSSRTYRNELENVNLNYNSEKCRTEQTYEDQIESLKLQLKNIKVQSESKIQDLERKLDYKDGQLIQTNKELEVKEKMATQIVEDLRLEMTHNNERQLRKKQFEYNQLESELKEEIQEKTKEIIDLIQQLSSHKQETEVKLTEIRKWSDNQKSSLINEWKLEKQSLEKDVQFQLGKVNEEHRKATEKLIDEKNKKMIEMQNLFDNVMREIPILKRELYQQTQIHKKEMNDLFQLYENEKIQLVEEHKVVVEKLNNQKADLKCNFEEKHAEHISQILSKTNEKLKEIEDEYSERSMQSFKVINELKLLTEKLKEEKHDLISAQEEFKINLTKKHQTEMENLQKVIKMNLETYKKEMGNDQIKYKNVEKHLEKKEHDYKKQINLMKHEYESKLSKLMSLEVQSDYEETIQSLRSQISFLQQKIGILEEEINSMNAFQPCHINGFSKHKCEQYFES